jgi:hypothetical protein
VLSSDCASTSFQRPAWQRAFSIFSSLAQTLGWENGASVLSQFPGSALPARWCPAAAERFTQRHLFNTTLGGIQPHALVSFRRFFSAFSCFLKRAAVSGGSPSSPLACHFKNVSKLISGSSRSSLMAISASLINLRFWKARYSCAVKLVFSFLPPLLLPLFEVLVNGSTDELVDRSAGLLKAASR